MRSSLNQLLINWIDNGFIMIKDHHNLAGDIFTILLTQLLSFTFSLWREKTDDLMFFTVNYLITVKASNHISLKLSFSQ